LVSLKAADPISIGQSRDRHPKRRQSPVPSNVQRLSVRPPKGHVGPAPKLPQELSVGRIDMTRRSIHVPRAVDGHAVDIAPSHEISLTRKASPRIDIEKDDAPLDR